MSEIDVSYDGGSFDKDAQGWVEDLISVVQTGDELLVQRSGRAEVYGLGRRHPHAGFVELVSSAPHPWWVAFDLFAGRLVGGRAPTHRMLTRPPRPGPGLRDDPVAVLALLAGACAAATRAIYPASVVAPPGADVLRALLAGTNPSPRLDVVADPGPGLTLLAWRDAAGAFTGASARTSAEVGEPFAAASVRSAGELDLHAAAPTLERMDAAFAAFAALGL